MTYDPMSAARFDDDLTRHAYDDWDPPELGSDERAALRRRDHDTHAFSFADDDEPWDYRCRECGERFRDDDERAEVYLDPETMRANAGGQYVLVDDMPAEAFGPFLVHADPCYRAESGGRPKYAMA